MIKVIRSTHPDRNKSGYRHRRNTMKKALWCLFCTRGPIKFTVFWKIRGAGVEVRPAGPMGLVNHSQTPRPFAHNVIRLIQYLHHRSLSAMLSNKAPNLEAKMEKGISNSQAGGRGGVVITIVPCNASHFQWKTTIIFWPLTHTAPLIITQTGRTPQGQCQAMAGG